MKLIKEIKTKQTISAIEVAFTYSESCNNVYKNFAVHIGGKKSNVKGLRKNCEADSEPSILTDNTYFWSPSRNASGRRYNEAKHETRVYEYLTDNGFKTISNVNGFENLLLKGEKFILDAGGGYCLMYRGMDYHIGYKVAIKELPETLALAREGIKKKRLSNLILARKAKITEKDLESIMVTRQDSIKAGNCVSGTDSFIQSFSLEGRECISASELLAIKDNNNTRRVVDYVVTNKVTQSL